MNEKVGTLGKSLEETQERVRVNEQKIGEVDQKARLRPTRPPARAEVRRLPPTRHATQAGEVGKRADARAGALEAETRKLIFETVISEDSRQVQVRSRRTA